MKKLTNLFFWGLLLVVINFSCSSKNEFDRTTPQKSITTLIKAINSRNNEILDSIISRNVIQDLLPSSNDNDKLLIAIEYFEELDVDTVEVQIRVKLRQFDSSNNGNSKLFDKIFSLKNQNQNWIISSVRDFTWNKPSKMNGNKALSLVYGTKNDTIFRDIEKDLYFENMYILISTSSSEGESCGTGFDVTLNGAILKWNGLKWVVKKKVDNLMTISDSNHSGIYVNLAYLLKDNTLFFLINYYQELETEIQYDYVFLNQELVKFYEYVDNRSWNPIGSIEKKEINLPSQYKYYTYGMIEFENFIKNNIKLRKRTRYNENNEPIYIEIWYANRDEIMAEGSVVQDPNNSMKIVYDGYWYDKSANFKGVFDKGKLKYTVSDMSNFINEPQSVEKCQWCKMGVIVNGCCDMCGSLSTSTKNRLNANINSRNMKYVDCPVKSTHSKLIYPNECSYCGFSGGIK